MALQNGVSFGILSFMRAFLKYVCTLSLCLLLIALPGCKEKTVDAYENGATTGAGENAGVPVATVRMVPITMAPTFTPSPTPTASPTPTPEPTLTPLPTPTPTPTSIPMGRRDFEAEVREVLFPLLSEEPEPAAAEEPLFTPDPEAQAVGHIAAMVFANVPVREKPSDTAKVLGRESYHLLYIHSIQRDFCYVTTQEGRTGYVKTAQVKTLTDTELEAYLSASLQLTYTAAKYTPDAFVTELTTSRSKGDMEERIYAALCRLGFDFEPFYYRVFRKDLQDSVKYPRYYKDEVYNSLKYKLFNSTGSMVYYEGHRTQWEHVPANGALQTGDILFFTELPLRSTGVMEYCEFVMAGQHSGNITSCAVYLGEDSILTVRDGRLEQMDGFSGSELYKSLDSARRIHLEVFDEKQLIIEDMIAQIYDCLGTPYNNFDRFGDYSFDCSGLICWVYMRMGMYPRGNPGWQGTTASGLSNISTYVWQKDKQVHMVIPVTMEEGRKSLDSFERGDIVFILGSGGGSIGHVMVYLGDGRVIHSTYISKRHTGTEYSGTVVANFRKSLQKDYYLSLRIENVN